MISCRLDLDDKYGNGKVLKFQCAGIGLFPVFTGIAPYTNQAENSMMSEAAIPPGHYYIVERPKGGMGFRKWLKERSTGNKYDDWFGLYALDGVINDRTYIWGQERGNFRIHPLRPDGTGLSEGCITFFTYDDFYNFRRHVLRAHKRVLASGLVIYGEVIVTGNMKNEYPLAR
jgi:Protein of unknown function (DUF2778).